MGPGALPSGKWGLTFGSERWKCFLSPYTFQGSRQVGQPSEWAAELWLLPSPSAHCSWAVSLRPLHPACAQLGLPPPCPPWFSCLGRNREGACGQRPCVYRFTDVTVPAVSVRASSLCCLFILRVNSWEQDSCGIPGSPSRGHSTAVHPRRMPED